jgi:hypothetical protein
MSRPGALFPHSTPPPPFCERINSVAEDILTEERTLLLDERELEVVTVLRINRTSMEYMKEMHPDLVQGFLAAANKAAEEGAGGRKQAPQ